MANTRRAFHGLVREFGQPAARWRFAHGCEQHTREPHVPGKAQASMDLGWPVYSLQRLADQAPFRRRPELRPERRASIGRFLGELAEREGPAAVHYETVRRVGF